MLIPPKEGLIPKSDYPSVPPERCRFDVNCGQSLLKLPGFGADVSRPPAFRPSVPVHAEFSQTKGLVIGDRVTRHSNWSITRFHSIDLPPWKNSIQGPLMSTPELPQPLPGPATGLEFPPHPPVRVKPQAPAETTHREKPAIRAAEARWLDVAQLLLLEPTSPFHEQNILHRVTHLAEAAALTAERDAHGNLMIDLPTSGESHQIPLLLTAHADHPGFWAEDMIGRNTLSAHWIGRVPRGYFLGAAVRFVTPTDDAGSPARGSFPLGGKAVRGRITRVSEYRGEGDYARVEIETDAEVAPGSIGQWDLPPCEFIDGQIHATAVDDVAGVAALVCVMQE